MMDGGSAEFSRDNSALTESSLNPDVQLAQAAAGDSVGRIETIKGIAFVTRTDGTKIKAAAGLEIFQGDVVETGAKGSVSIVFSDDSTFALADEGQMTIDEMVFDPGAQAGNAALSVTQGVFTFVSGQIAKTGVDAMLIQTPTSTIGIRGTSLAAKIGAKTGDTFTLLPDQNAPGTGAPAGGSGEITISNSVGAQTLNTPNATSLVSSAYSSPTLPVNLPAAVVARAYGSAIAINPAAASAGGNPSGGNQGGAERQTEGGAEAEGAEAAEEAAAEAFNDALAGGASIDDAILAATGAATETRITAILTGDPNAFGTPQSILSVADGLVDASLGGLGVGQRDPLNAGTGDQTVVAESAREIQEFVQDSIVTAIGQGPGGQGGAGLPGQGLAGPGAFLQEFFLPTFETVLEVVEQQVERNIDQTIQDLEEQAASNPTVTLTPGPGTVTLTNNQNDFINAQSAGTYTISGTAQAGDVFTGTSGSDSVVMNTDGVDHVFRLYDTEHFSMSNVGSGQSFALNVASAGTTTISLSPTGSLAISGTPDGSTSTDLNQSFVLVSDGSIGTGNTLQISGSGGSDTLTLDAGTHTIESMAGIEYFHMVNSVTTVNSALSGVTVDASSGSSLSLAGTGNTITINASSTLTSLTGGSGIDSVTGNSSVTVTNISNVEAIAGGGSTLIGLANGGQTVTSLSGTMTTFTGGGGDDTVSTAGVTITTLLGGSGTDTVNFGGTTNTVTNVNGIETFAGGTGTDSISFANAAQSVVVTGTIETLTGGSADEVITFGSSGGSLTNVSAIATIVGGTGSDSVSFSSANHTTVLSAIELVTGGSQNDVLSLNTAQSSGTFNLGSGNGDKITLANGTNSISVSGTETIIGGTGADTVSVSGSVGVDFSAGTGNDTFTGGGGADTFTGGAGADTATGGAGADRYVFSGAAAGGLGSDVITDFSGATAFGGGSGHSDVFVLNTSNLNINSIAYEEVSWDGTTGAITLGNANATVIVLHNTAGTLTDAITALVAGNAAGDATSGDAIILFNNSANGNYLQAVHTDDATSGGANLNTLATLTNNTTATNSDDLDAADFAVQA